MDNRTNFVKVENLAVGLTGDQLFKLFEPYGDILEITALSPTRRSSVDSCVMLTNNQPVIGNSRLRVESFYPKQDPSFNSSSVLQGLGRNIGINEFNYDPSSFVPWQGETSNCKPAVAQPSGASTATSSLSAAQIRNIVIGGPYSNLLGTYCTPWTIPSPGEDIPDCSICLDVLGQRSSYNIYSDQLRSLTLVDCKHTLHQSCVEKLIAQSPSQFLQCPECRKIYGTRTGTRPISGTISHTVLNISLPGHPNSRTFQLTFNFTAGIQGPEHPNPGKHYSASNFPRQAYLPDSPEGLKALHGIYLAWENRLMFTVGQSVTTLQVIYTLYNT
ncbi:uncharacterized protein LOC111717321 isoform X2 [Eurytemora carolleeae]|uniref:uncharacterized protein LOC111717321 isoform X2 n=1 Tax=Eurytemora carolleeae TaxID=1294199 RepID=UPI000C761895|nr:uncharacterized protein LOC111717321 isoform X2 [Eurytemora carolleeae]|eukprot:XP_023348587.1 uncharacterized protein LOC111717321 isoform X2 [Eurytemora affinis]